MWEQMERRLSMQGCTRITFALGQHEYLLNGSARRSLPMDALVGG